MKFMPLMFGFLFYGFSSGLVLYWLTSNLVGVLQQVVLNRMPSEPLEIEQPKRRKKRKRAVDLRQPPLGNMSDWASENVRSQIGEFLDPLLSAARLDLAYAVESADTLEIATYFLLMSW